MARNSDRLEPLEDGFTGFRTADGQRWKHKDMAEGRVGPGYRLFISESGEERRYTFGRHEVHDATLLDLREQLAKATSVAAATSGRSTADFDSEAGRELSP
jgi:hypothetical protein